jgi:formylglycine-generating enzyme required for sulfatase activity
LQYVSARREDAALASDTARGVDPAGHLRHCRKLAEQGYRPATITATEAGKANEVVFASVWHAPVGKERLARRQAQAAVALVQLGEADTVWPLLQHSRDPDLRTQLVHRFGLLETSPKLLIQRLETERDDSARRALVLSLGEFPAEQLPEELRGPLVQRLLDWYSHDPDPGLHSAIDWLLRHDSEGEVARKLGWRQREELGRIDRDLARRPRGAERRWYLNSQGQTLAILPGPIKFDMGSVDIRSPAREAGRSDREVRHRVHIDRSLALATKPVTVQQFQRFLDANPTVRRGFRDDPRVLVNSPEPDGPIIKVTWYEAAQYCRWLSDREEVPEEQKCYPPIGDIKEGMKLPADYLQRTGYRLPTEAEWEYACRADAATSWYFGDSAAMLGRYAWFSENAKDRAWPVGQKKPNDFGLFDMHGNVWQWCHDRPHEYPIASAGQAARDVEDTRNVTDENIRLVRGGSFFDRASVSRSPYRNPDAHTKPSDRNMTIGFRVARTHAP